MKISTVSQMREMDQTAITEYGIPEELLMENAGLAACEVIRDHIGIESKTFLIFCGLGNNGGDGFVIARKIHSLGGQAKVFLLGDPSRYKGAAKLNLDMISKMPVECTMMTSVESMRSDLAHCDVIVDAIFGTGLARNVEGKYADVIKAINAARASGKPVLSADIPSGVHGDTGAVMGAAVNADYTITFGLPKIGNLLYPGYDHGGRLFVTHISFPRALYTNDSLKIALNAPLNIPSRNPAGHKGSFGESLFIAGASSYYGAPLLSALSFLKAGGGYSRLAAPASIAPFIAASGHEIVFIPQKETDTGSISSKNKSELLELSEKTEISVLGPGISLNSETGQLARELAAEIKKPLLIDGDGITALCADPDIIRCRSAETVLTPHYGEMARIVGRSAAEITADPIGILQEAARNLNAVIVLKGAHSLIGYPDGRVFVNKSGNSGMATAGSGDVLTGTIAAMSGLGFSFEDAVRQGVFIHGLAGDLAAKAMGPDGMTARNIMNFLPASVKSVRENLNMIQKQYAVTVL